ncbi:MAG: LysR family transcriptional regulator, partial [Pseudomonadota bacterium]
MARKYKHLGVRLRLVLGPDIAIGPGKVDLLEQVQATGSIAEAGRTLGMSYKR